LQSMVTKDEDKYVQNDVWILDTTGTNLMDVLSQDFIDKYRTVSNDIKEVYDVLGIEAAREVIHNELMEVMEFSGVYINYHHVSLLCDRMTCNKDMVSIFRSGILNDNIGPISKSTFEVHTEVLMNASRHAELDHMRGVSASVMMGQFGKFGTGAFQVVLDMNKMKEMDDEEVDEDFNCDQIDKELEMDKSKENCKMSVIEINNNIGAIKKEQGDACEDDYDAGF
jgi:DNA-directed RNA polymerase II subunit RPB1